MLTFFSAKCLSSYSVDFQSEKATKVLIDCNTDNAAVAALDETTNQAILPKTNPTDLCANFYDLCAKCRNLCKSSEIVCLSDSESSSEGTDAASDPYDSECHQNRSAIIASFESEDTVIVQLSDSENDDAEEKAQI